ncbi:hypothetical protein J41TS12_10520 [Paenibacillus antibioticophila]|uniref:Uncharacterized protein n=1 Tax=Paenibacillus antibioticophila TaxID=1274374 RepID=A0A920CDS7_9BACL|nr:hypothetical protein [Paenibacillus antibioticophila]GIO36191.1 hypothetical protein J41TS12_10520 [Paenibacillus antibioticophila]
MIRMFRSRDSAEAIELVDGEMATIKRVIQFTGCPVTVNYDTEGNVVAGIIKSPNEMLVAKVGQFICKESSGKLSVCDYEKLIEKYEEITEETAS